MCGRAYLGSTQFERAEPWLSPPVVHADLAPAPVCERPYAEVELLTISMADPSARGWVCRYVVDVHDYESRGSLPDLANFNESELQRFAVRWQEARLAAQTLKYCH